MNVKRYRVRVTELDAVTARVAYTNTADELTTRIVALGPQVMEIASAWDLFKVPGFHCQDLQPSLFQVQWSLSRAKAILREQQVAP